MEQLEELNLLKRAVNGDGEAFSDLIGRHYLMIYKTAYKWCGNRQDAEDIAQDVCIKVGSAIGGFRMDSAFSSWLYRITLNTVRDYQRKARPNVELDAVLETLSGGGNAEDTVSRRELWEAVQALPEKQRDAILLVYAEELNHKQAADIMECPENTVSWYIHEAKKQLKLMMDNGR